MTVTASATVNGQTVEKIVSENDMYRVMTLELANIVSPCDINDEFYHSEAEYRDMITQVKKDIAACQSPDMMELKKQRLESYLFALAYSAEKIASHTK